MDTKSYLQFRISLVAHGLMQLGAVVFLLKLEALAGDVIPCESRSQLVLGISHLSKKIASGRYPTDDKVV